jgi:hypothetical protein
MALGFRYRNNPFKLLLGLVLFAIIAGLIAFDIMWLIGKFGQLSRHPY